MPCIKMPRYLNSSTCSMGSPAYRKAGVKLLRCSNTNVFVFLTLTVSPRASSLVTPVFKKGDRSDPGNYRPIAVGEPLCRLYAAILNKRIISWTEDKGLRAPCQAGFRPRMSTEQQLFALRHFIDRSRFQKQPLFAAFVDLKKAYDSVQHDLLLASLQRLGVHGSMLAAVQSLYDGGTMRMKISGRAGASGTARVGVRQGCPLSPILFGIFFDDLHARLLADCPTAGLDCQGLSVPALFYADDVMLLSDTASGLQRLLDSMQGFCLASGLTVSIPKTEVVVFGGGHHACAGQLLGSSCSVVGPSHIWACCSTKIGTSSMQSSTGMPRLWRLWAPSSRAIVTSNVPTPCSYSSVFSKLFCSRVRPMHARYGRQQQQLQVP